MVSRNKPSRAANPGGRRTSMKIKTYAIYKAGSTQVGTICATCITKAVKQFIETLENPASFELSSKAQASIRYIDNYNVMGDFVAVEL